MRLRGDSGITSELAVNTNSFVDVGLLDVSWVRVLQRHHLACNNNHYYILTNYYYCYSPLM